MAGETRTTTVLFTDLAGSTALLSRVGREAADEIRLRHFADLREGLEAHGGREVKTLGDGVMAAFGSVRDGLACAETLQRGVARSNGRGGERLGLRVGLATGDVTVEGQDLFGLPVVEASRLCAACAPGQVLVSQVVRLLAGPAADRLRDVGELVLKGLPASTRAWELAWEPPTDAPLRVAIADDAVLLREGLARVLEGEGLEVVHQASDAEGLVQAVRAARPDVVVLDVRMPPTHTDEGLRAAEALHAAHPEVGVLVLSQSISAGAARRLLAGERTGVGYLLKERVGEVAELVAAIRQVAAGGVAIDPELELESV